MGAEPDRIALLAKLIRSRKRGSDTIPYTLFLGAGASLSSGASLFDELIREVGATDYDDFSSAVKSLSPDERYALVAPKISCLTPSRAARGLARLALDGYFGLILTTNFDDLLERSLLLEGANSTDFMVHVNSPTAPLTDLGRYLTTLRPSINIIKLHGDLFKRIFALTDDETYQFQHSLEDAIRRHFSHQDCIVLGSAMKDLDLLRCFDSSGGSIWHVNPSPPRDYFLAAMKKRSCDNCIIAGDEGTFDVFIDRLVGVLDMALPPRTKEFRIVSHKYVPFYAPRGSPALQRAGEEKKTLYGAYKAVQLTDADSLCIFPFPVALWHRVESRSFTSLTEAAIWRRRTYRDILYGDIPEHISEILGAPDLDLEPESLRPLVSKPGYVLSLIILDASIWNDGKELRNAIKILACPSILQSDSARDDDDLPVADAVRLEQELLSHGFQSSDFQEFGLPGRGLGYASWAGVCYFPQCSPGIPLSEIVDFEINLQALWWFCNCMRQLGLCEHDVLPKDLVNQIRRIPIHMGRLRGIGPTENLHVRTMREAIVHTSRIQNIASDAAALFSHLALETSPL